MNPPAKFLELSAKRYPEKIAFVIDMERITYKELNDKVNRFGNSLKKLGVSKGNQVLIFLPNSIEYLISSFAVWKLGGIVVPVGACLRENEIKFLVGKLKSNTIVTIEDLKEEVKKAIKDVSVVNNLIITSKDGGSFEAMVKDGSSYLEIAEYGSEDIYQILFTSGTAGNPKGVMRTIESLETELLLAISEYQFSTDDVVISGIPLYTIVGFLIVILPSLVSRAIVISMSKFDPINVLTLIEQKKCTFFVGFPPMFNDILQAKRKLNIKTDSLKRCYTSGQTMPAHLRAEFEKEFNTFIFNTYGSTEASFITVNNLLDNRGKGSVGLPCAGVKIKICDDKGNTLKQGQVGEIVVSSPFLMKGYYKEPEETRKVLKAGWYYTGDMGYIDKDGYLFILGRKDDLIIRNANNIYPKEVENVLYSHPKVVEVIVYGVPHPVKGQEVTADIVLKPRVTATQEEIIHYCKKKMASYKCPGVVEFVKILKRGKTGKIIKK